MTALRALSRWVLTCVVLSACGQHEGPKPNVDGGGGDGGGDGTSAQSGAENAPGGSSGAGGSPDGSQSGAGGSTSGAGGSTLTEGGQSGAGGSTSGTGGSASGAGGKSMLPGECEGAFGDPMPQFLVDRTALPSNLSLTGDGLEMYFSLGDSVSVRTRTATNQSFSDAREVSELRGVCLPLGLDGLDVVPNGLRLYIACSDDSFNGPLMVATRPNRQSPFVAGQESLGTVGSSISISSDELVLYAASTPGPEGQVLMYQRASSTDRFGAGGPVPGLAVPFRFPEISSDDQNLFGAVTNGNVVQLAVATRRAPSEPFSAPTTVGFPAPPADSVQLSPAVSDDCSQLYFLNLTMGNPNPPVTVDMIRR